MIFHIQGLAWEFRGGKIRRYMIDYEGKEEKRKDVYFVWEFLGVGEKCEEKNLSRTNFMYISF